MVLLLGLHGPSFADKISSFAGSDGLPLCSDGFLFFISISSDIDSSFDIISYRLSKGFEKKGDISIVSYRNGNFHIATSLVEI